MQRSLRLASRPACCLKALTLGHFELRWRGEILHLVSMVHRTVVSRSNGRLAMAWAVLWWFPSAAALLFRGLPLGDILADTIGQDAEEALIVLLTVVVVTGAAGAVLSVLPATRCVARNH